MSLRSRRAERREDRRRSRELTRISVAYNRGLISLNTYLRETEAIRTGRPPQPPTTEQVVGPPSFLRCPVCSHAVPDHAEHCFMRPGAISAPRGGIEYLRARGFATPDLTASAGTPLYDELVAERRIDPCRDAAIRRDEETFRELSERFARSARVPGPLMQQQELVIRGATPENTVNLTQWQDDPIVEHARELYHLGHFGDVGSFPARRALARMISGRALDEAARPRYRSGWGQPFERTDP